MHHVVTEWDAQPCVLPGFEVSTNDDDIRRTLTNDPLRLHDEGGFLDYHEPQPVFGDECALALVVNASLLTTSHPGDGRPTVEEGYSV